MPSIQIAAPLRSIKRAVGFAALAITLTACGEKLSREDFAAAVKDKTTADVQSAMGKPHAVDESAAGMVKWTYKSKTFSTGDSATKLDKQTIVVFQQRDPNAPATVADVQYD
jgi:hypothetical protein